MLTKFNNFTAAFWSSICGCFFADKRCLACHIPFIPHEHDFLCQKCQLHIEYKQEPVCKLCGHRLFTNAEACIECISNPPPWDALSHYGQYNELLKHIILKYKFSADLSMIPLLNHYLVIACQDLPPCDIIIPMPRHEKRLVSEGFNHVLELGKLLTKELHIPLLHKALIRTRYTPPQSSLNAKQRKNNPQKSFMSSQVEGKNVLLIDDIITTGSTLRHACLSLREGGAKHIYVAIIARVDK